MALILGGIVVQNKELDMELLPYPLPPWKHRFRTLSVFCEVEESIIGARVPKPLKLESNIVQITVMHFESSIPTRPYYDSAVIAQVSYDNKVGGHWIHAFTSTDQVCAGTREIWGFQMKLAAMELHIDKNRIWGFTERLGRKIINIDMSITNEAFEPIRTFPRLLKKALPEADKPNTRERQVIQLPAETNITETVWGMAEVSFEESVEDPIYLLKPKRIIGASLVSGNQILPWGVVLS